MTLCASLCVVEATQVHHASLIRSVPFVRLRRHRGVLRHLQDLSLLRLTGNAARNVEGLRGGAPTPRRVAADALTGTVTGPEPPNDTSKEPPSGECASARMVCTSGVPPLHAAHGGRGRETPLSGRPQDPRPGSRIHMLPMHIPNNT